MICAVSTKTTGLKPELHEVIELAIKPLDQNPVYYRIKPEKPENYLPLVQEINGISLVVANAFMPRDQAEKLIINIWGDITVLGHNCIFDFTMLRATFGQGFVDKFYSKDFIDTMDLAMAHDTKLLMDGKKKIFKNYQLKHVASVLGIPFTHKCEVLVGVYNALSNQNASDS